MCSICGVVSEKFRPESTYWGKMCEYVTGSKAIMTKGCFASGIKYCFVTQIDNRECFAIIDGEINNTNALKYNLNLHGIVFETGNVAELVLLCYIYFGERVFKIIKGKFTAVIWNGCENELILLRDKVGINTIFYYFDDLRFAFASEIKGVLMFPFVKKELCDDIYCRLFALSSGLRQNETLFSNIYEVPPGCFIRHKNFKTQVVSYHTFCLKDSADNFNQTVSGIEYLCKNCFDMPVMTEKVIGKQKLADYIERYVEISDFPTPYINLKTLSNLDSNDVFADFMWIFNVSERFELPSVWCKMQDIEYVNRFLSTLPWFEHKDEKDITKKEGVYIKQYIVIPQLVYARKKACKNLVFPLLDEEITDYSLKSLKYAKKLSKLFACDSAKRNKENYKNLKELFNEMLLCDNAMCGLIDKQELIRLTKVSPRPETMLYLLQVDAWLKKYL